MKAYDLLTYMDMADPIYVEEASDRRVMHLRKRRKQALRAACACLVAVLLIGCAVAEPLKTAWDLRDTVTSWTVTAFRLPMTTVKPSVGIFVSAELPTRKRLPTDEPFPLAVGLGQLGSYPTAVIEIHAPDFAITDARGLTVTDHYTYTVSDFDSGNYGMVCDSRGNLTGCVHVENFTFRYIGGDGTGCIGISLMWRDGNETAGDTVSLYYTVKDGSIRLTKKLPADGSTEEKLTEDREREITVAGNESS